MNYFPACAVYILVSHKNPWAGPTENENEREDQLMKRNEIGDPVNGKNHKLDKKGNILH